MGAILGRTYPRESGGDVPPYSPADASRECIAPGPQAGRREAGLQQLPSRGLSWDFLGRHNEEHAEDKGPEEDPGPEKRWPQRPELPRGSHGPP